MTKYRIKPKRDFGSGPGFWLPGAGEHGTHKYGFVKHGFVVTDGLCNIMPGACWFRTVADAMQGLADWLAVDGDAAAFWALRTARKGGSA